MKKLQSQLNTIAKSLASLAGKVEQMSAKIGKAPAPKKTAPAKKTKAKKVTPKKKVKTQKAAAGKDTVLDNVYGVINKSRDGATIAQLKTKTGLESRQLSNALYKLSKKGKIKSKSRGVYIKA